VTEEAFAQEKEDMLSKIGGLGKLWTGNLVIQMLPRMVNFEEFLSLKRYHFVVSLFQWSEEVVVKDGRRDIDGVWSIKRFIGEEDGPVPPLDDFETDCSGSFCVIGSASGEFQDMAAEFGGRRFKFFVCG
jgi:hypothetical protein